MKFHTTKYDICQYCGGSGKQKAPDAANNPNTTVPICIHCGGSGKIEVHESAADHNK